MKGNRISKSEAVKLIADARKLGLSRNVQKMSCGLMFVSLRWYYSVGALYDSGFIQFCFDRSGRKVTTSVSTYDAVYMKQAQKGRWIAQYTFERLEKQIAKHYQNVPNAA